MSDKMKFAKIIDKVTDDVCDGMAAIAEAMDEAFEPRRAADNV